MMTLRVVAMAASSSLDRRSVPTDAIAGRARPGSRAGRRDRGARSRRRRPRRQRRGVAVDPRHRDPHPLAPATSMSARSPTNSARPAAMPRPPSAASKISGLGLRQPTAAETTTRSNSRSIPSRSRISRRRRRVVEVGDEGEPMPGPQRAEQLAVMGREHHRPRQLVHVRGQEARDGVRRQTRRIAAEVAEEISNRSCAVTSRWVARGCARPPASSRPARPRTRPARCRARARRGARGRARRWTGCGAR